MWPQRSALMPVLDAALDPDLPKPYIRHTKSVHPAYEMCSPNLYNFFIRAKKVCVRPTNCVQREHQDLMVN